MAEISNMVSSEKLSGFGGRGEEEEVKEEAEERMRVSHLQGELQSMTGPSDSFVLDVESLSRVADSDSMADARYPLQKSSSRKVSQRSDRKSAPASSPHASSKGNHLTWPVASSEYTVTLLPSSAGAAATNGAAGATTAPAFRNCHVGRRALWPSPRRVLLFFATLSSMGTIILLYFTLSMSKMDGGDVNVR